MIRTVGELMDELLRYSRSTPLTMLSRSRRRPAHQTILVPMRVSGRIDAGVDVVCRDVLETKIPVAGEEDTWTRS